MYKCFGKWFNRMQNQTDLEEYLLEITESTIIPENNKLAFGTDTAVRQLGH